MGAPCYGKRDPYYSHIFRDSYGNGMGIVWEAYHQGVPLLGVPGITLDKFGWRVGKTHFLGGAFAIKFIFKGSLVCGGKSSCKIKLGVQDSCCPLNKRMFAVQICLSARNKFLPDLKKTGANTEKLGYCHETCQLLLFGKHLKRIDQQDTNEGMGLACPVRMG